MSDRLLDQRWPWLLAAGIILAVFFATSIDFSDRIADPRPVGDAEDILALRERDDVNVLFVLIDTLRADRLGSYGYERDTSPGLDRLADTGVRFARHLAQASWTKASMASLWMGLYPRRAGINRFDEVIPPHVELPAETLSNAGFYSAGIYRNGWVAASFGFDQGFDVYTRPAPRPVPPSVRRENPTVSDQLTDESAIESALEFLRVHGRKRWFLYVHMMDVHEYLYDLESAKFGSDHSSIYDNSILHTDSILEVLTDTLRVNGMHENTVIVIASDHGEAFGERGFEGHAREVFKETTEVPLILSFPFRLEPGIVVEARTRNVDIWPTLFDLLGIEASGEIDGRSLVPAIVASARGEAVEEESAIAHLDRRWGQHGKQPLPTVAVAEEQLRYVRYPRPEQPEGMLEQLFDAGSDPAELNDLAADRPETLERLRAEADRYLESDPVYGEASKRELDQMELNHLRALGYALP